MPATPYLRVDLARLRRNIQRAAELADSAGVALRPHVKTHKSVEIARLQVAAGAAGVSVATIGEAETFVRHGIDDVFVAYPLWLDDAVASVRGSLERLGLDHLDLQLIHWPNPSVGRYAEAWRALVDLQKEGLVRSIGVSNFTEAHLTRIIEETGVTPAVNQIELHPYFPQAPMRAVNERLGIRTESWSPLGKRQAPFTEPPVATAAEKYAVTPGQVILRWQVQLGSIPIPKSATPTRQRENLDVFGFSLTDDEVAAITGLGRPDGRLFGGDPDHHEEQ